MDLDVKTILDDPFTSTWLKNSLNTSLQRDPIDAVFDAELLARVLNKRADAALADSGAMLLIEDEDE